MEYIRGYLKLRVNKRAIGVDDIDVYEAIVRGEWAKIGSGYLEALVASIPARCAAVIAAKGGNTKYSKIYILPYNRDFIYQEDGAPIHTSKYAKWYKTKNEVKGFDVWPANSPDLNPIEHIWGYLKLRVNKRAIGVDDINVFEAIVRDEWALVTLKHWLLQYQPDVPL